MVRVFMRATSLFDLNHHQDGYWEAVAECVRRCNAAGVRVELVIFCDTKDMPADERRDFLGQVLARYAQHQGVVLQIVNEPGQIMQGNWSGPTDSELLSYADIVASACGHRDFSIGDAADGSDPDASAETAAQCVELAKRSNIIVLHSSRDGGVASIDDRFRRWIDHMEGFYDIVSQCRAVNPNAWGFHDEPMGFAGQTPVQGHDRETDPQAALAGELTAQMIGCGFTYHYISEQNDGTPGLDLCGQFVPDLPADPSWSYRNDSWQGSATRGYSGFGKVRTWTNGASAFVLASGASKGSVNWANGFSPRETKYDGQNMTLWYAD